MSRKCFCVGNIFHFLIAFALFVLLSTHIALIVSKQKSCREMNHFPEYLDDNKIDIFNRFENRRMNVERPSCKMADIDKAYMKYYILGWIAIGITVIIILITAGLGSGVALSKVAHRRLGLKIGNMMLQIMHLVSFIPTLAMIFLSEVLFLHRVRENFGGHHESHYLKHRFIVSLIALGVSALYWIITLIHSSVLCCCTPTENTDEPPKYFKSYVSNVSEDKLKLVDNVVFGERVNDMDASIA